jgi:hypothetical protein
VSFGRARMERSAIRDQPRGLALNLVVMNLVVMNVAPSDSCGIAVLTAESRISLRSIRVTSKVFLEVVKRAAKCAARGRPKTLVAHDLFGKPASPLPDHAQPACPHNCPARALRFQADSRDGAGQERVPWRQGGFARLSRTVARGQRCLPPAPLVPTRQDLVRAEITPKVTDSDRA